MLGPLDKYVKYGRFPWKFIVHIIMLMLTVAMYFIVLSPDLHYSTAFYAQLYQQFMTTTPEDFTPPMNNPDVMLYNITELKLFVNRTVTNYYNIASDENLDFFLPNTDADGFVVPVLMFLTLFDADSPIVVYQLTP